MLELMQIVVISVPVIIVVCMWRWNWSINKTLHQRDEIIDKLIHLDHFSLFKTVSYSEHMAAIFWGRKPNYPLEIQALIGGKND